MSLSNIGIRGILLIGFLLFAFGWMIVKDLKRKPRKPGPLKGMDLYQKGFDLMKMRDYREAAGILEKYLTEAPEDWVALFDLARCYIHLGDWETALRLFNKALEINPESVETRSEIASILAEHVKDFDKADSHMAAIQEQMQSETDLWQVVQPIFIFQQAWIHLKKGDTTTALDYFNQSAGVYFRDIEREEIDEIFANVHYQMGIFYQLKNNPTAAKSSFQKAIASAGPQSIFTQQAEKKLEEL